MQDESKRKIRKLEETIKEKDNNMARMQKQHEEYIQQAEKDIEDFKQQVHANSTKMYMDMKATDGQGITRPQPFQIAQRKASQRVTEIG